MRVSWCQLLLGLLLAVVPLAAGATLAPAGDDKVEVAAGGVLFAPHASLVVAQQELRIGPDSIHVEYALRNIDDTVRTYQLTVPLPDLDTQAYGQSIDLPRLDPANFVAASLEVDRVPVVPQVEQRAIALGLDVSEVLTKQGLPLFPYAAGLRERLAALPDAVKRDFEERGILHVDDERVDPYWTLKTVLHWRQRIAPSQTVRIVLGYTPIVGRAVADAETVAARERSHCIDSRAAAAMQAPASRAVAGGAASGGPSTKRQMRLVGYNLSTGQVLPGAIASFRLIIEKPDDHTIVALCREGLAVTGARSLEWTASDYWPDDDLHVLFVR